MIQTIHKHQNDESYNPKNEERLSEPEQRLDMLHNVFRKERSDLRREMEDLIRTEVTANTGQVGSGQNSRECKKS